jgi:dinuclear metal center YbgI/SA1388 family protein
VSDALRVGDALEVLETIAPGDLAEAWDHVGLQVGAADQPVARVLVALEMTDGLAARLPGGPPTLVVSHHPLLFRPLESVRRDRPTGRHVTALLRAEASLVACHTNWDKAPGGTDDALAAAIGLMGGTPLEPSERPLYRISVMVPEESLDDVREALAAAGAGASERYRRASFSVHGESTFEPVAGARPAFGVVGGFTVRPEQRLEMVVAGAHLALATRALLAAHPYEEPAYGVDRLEDGLAFGGLGRIGDWPEETALDALADSVRASLGAPGARVCGRRDRPVRRVASVGGAGRSLLSRAASLGADAIVTADIGHHDARLAEELGIGVVDAGHRETEQPGVRALATLLRKRLARAGRDVEVAFVDVDEVYGWRV